MHKIKSMYIYILNSPLKEIYKNTQMNINQYYHDNDILAQANRMNQKTINLRI